MLLSDAFNFNTAAISIQFTIFSDVNIFTASVNMLDSSFASLMLWNGRLDLWPSYLFLYLIFDGHLPSYLYLFLWTLL